MNELEEKIFIAKESLLQARAIIKKGFTGHYADDPWNKETLKKIENSLNLLVKIS